LWRDFLALGGFLAFFIPLCFMAANTAHRAAKRTR
jgi:heme exporter protein D